jgi:hypothetical protein
MVKSKHSPLFDSINLIDISQSNLPNLRRLFVEARTDAEESAYSRNAVYHPIHVDRNITNSIQFYNIVLFMSSVAVFSLVAQRMSKTSP